MPKVLYDAFPEIQRNNLTLIESLVDCSEVEDFICSIFELGEVSPSEADKLLERGERSILLLLIA